MIRLRSDLELGGAAFTASLDEVAEADAAAEYRAAILDERLRYLVRVDQPLVLIAQIGRSGGHLLLRMLDGHPQCHTIPYEMQKMFRGMSMELRDAEAAWRALATDKQFHRRRPFILAPALQRSIFEACLEETEEPTPRDVMDCYFTSFFNGWLDNTNLRTGPKWWVVGFEPRGTTKLDGHRRIYPDGRVLSIVRDPWSWFASARRKAKRWTDRDQAIDAWCTHVAAALEEKARDPSRTMLVLFYDVLDRTETTMRALAGWLGIDFVPSMLAPTFNGVPALARSSYHDVATEISSAPLHRASELSRADAAYIDRHARDLYEQAMSCVDAVDSESPRRSV